ncbi:MAG: toprim domain-containing protein [Candidatus Phytoplasma stylosanthis]|uniref:toprim domain-containing protein n=1 Tax=Candidatus Phytoplasma stylosanthis TaxID=2798314 RepID=UPI00293A77E9|nr:toprim domain-containing protein [Candidatus Phytoplasma stylosanthis]MDV3168158.1 toprim domain-containing protein [Candidatus Phytoplasma stylosanthis]MDV3173785.1 toprim domain-containing protein [Candidatus Phytoplasma stylosanthis]MDV3174390.1 toprim domain-containing protein [Candidatus Phytoplasma stylosanthis]
MNKQIEISDLKFKFPMLVLLKKLNLLPPHFPKHYRFPCPIHQGKNPTCCHINAKNCLHCWKCGKDYDIIDVYMAIRGIKNFSQTLVRINNFMKTQEFATLVQKEKEGTKTASTFFPSYQIRKSHRPLDEQEINLKKKQLLKTISPLFNQIRDYYHYLLINNNNDGLAYLTNQRKLTLTTIKEFNLGYAPPTTQPLSFRFVNYAKKKNFDINKLVEYGFLKARIKKEGQKYYHDNFQGSIIIPIENRDQQTFHFYQNHFRPVAYFQPKYQALTNFSQTPTFHFSYRFGQALPWIKQTQTMIIHEGFFDVISAWQNGFKNVVGLICVAQLLSQSQLAILQKEQIKVIIALDNDETGRQRGQKLGEQLQEANIRYEIRNILVPYAQTCKDADDLLRQYGKAAYQKCFLDPYEEAKKNNIVDLAIRYFGEDKVRLKNE